MIKIFFKAGLLTICLSVISIVWMPPAFSALNQATDPGGGGTTLTNSNNVTVNSSSLQIVKQVYDIAGNCLASQPASASCNSSATTTTVAAGATINFLIYVDNTTAAQASNIRIVDQLDETATGFTYVDNSLTWNNNVTATGATIATIYTDAAANALTDIESGADIASATDTGASPAGKDKITVGTAGTNATANITASKVFALHFQAIKK